MIAEGSHRCLANAKVRLEVEIYYEGGEVSSDPCLCLKRRSASNPEADAVKKGRKSVETSICVQLVSSTMMHVQSGRSIVGSVEQRTGSCR